eukprot:349709-Chlamydomonas_euryale.AAC.1
MHHGGVSVTAKQCPAPCRSIGLLARQGPAQRRSPAPGPARIPRLPAARAWQVRCAATGRAPAAVRRRLRPPLPAVQGTAAHRRASRLRGRRTARARRKTGRSGARRRRAAATALGRPARRSATGRLLGSQKSLERRLGTQTAGKEVPRPRWMGWQKEDRPKTPP